MAGVHEYVKNDPLTTALRTVLVSSSTYFTPLFIIGGVLIATTIMSVAAAHGPLPVVVKLSFTLPAVLSLAPGKYVAFKLVFDGEKLPVPEVLHIAPVALLNCPFKTTLALF